MKKNSYTFREALTETLNLNLYWDVEISREDFERLFTKTKESVEFTFGGWDGKSYDGESRKAKVLRSRIPGWEDCRFIKVGKHVHMVDEDTTRVEKATGIEHLTVGWVTEVKRG